MAAAYLPKLRIHFLEVLAAHQHFARLAAGGGRDEALGLHHVNQASGTVVSFMLPDSVAIADASSLFGPLFGADVRIAGRSIEATIDQPTAAVHRLTGWAMEAGVELEALAVHRASLEDVYLSLTGAPGSDVAIDGAPDDSGAERS